MADATLRVTLVKSSIGSKPKQRGTLRALGLRKIDQTVELPDRPEIRGMIAKVPHLIKVEEAAAVGSASEQAESSGKRAPASAERDEER